MTSGGDDRRTPPPLNPRAPHRRASRILSPVVAVLAALYFLVDALFLPPVHWIAKRVSRLGVFARVADWIRSLGPYQTLALFLIPFLALEPIKPVAAYLMATHRFTHGVILLVVGEILKLVIVERLFHHGRDKLMTIKAFAWAYNFVMRWLAYLQAQPAWQAIIGRVERARAAAHRAWRRLRAMLRSGRDVQRGEE